MTAAHPIENAWLSTGGTGAQNYDEYADESRITEIVAAKPTSMLAVEMPDRTPEAVAAGMSFTDCLPAAAERLEALQQTGRFARAGQVVVAYRISGEDRCAYGLFCMVDTDEISTSAEEPGRVIRNEDVFIEKVRQRAALNAQLRHLLSPVLLVQHGKSEELQAALADACVGEPAVTDVDEAGRRHEIWPVAPGPKQDLLCELAGGGDLIVADGNHRSLAAQVGELPRFLAVVTTPESVTIQPYHRLLVSAPLTGEALLDALRERGAEVTAVPGPLSTPDGVVHLYLNETVYAVRLPAVEGSIVERLDHARVESVLFNDILGMDAGDKRITYVGGDYPPSWLAEQVDSGSAVAAILIAAVTVEDFISVNLARLKLPRKSTWFTPKARAGLVLADLR
ncbi:DUF1015 family protein [Stackebrandtia nassauensis]|uniref:DUF1015 domain-containing protein n=1 Tax=Stackebrandtia nassauensis (strain DSM 44728 / CIP 108903 / NRRL B-16338 / NBRC 102104 / LLR-40K-21) TaxID=446470 RepID=D3PVV5_STANL|nr:DUF1015 family protein [Stackebrandtia nassauensis]ADD45076.1 conserved hypothetical protein [Stackebrandtia nassauensis DSM 44728]